MNIRIIPKLDIKGPNLIKGVNYEGLRSLGNPNHYAKLYYDQGADELILNDVVASLYGRENLYSVLNLASKDIFIPITAGGGIRNVDDVKNILKSGADKISINTAVLKQPKLINNLANIFGSSTICISIEAKKIGNDYYCYYNFGRDNSEKRVCDWINETQRRGAGEILLSSIDNDGTKLGLDLELLKKINFECDINIPLIFGSGIGKLSHLDIDYNFHKLNGIFIGSFLHYENLDLSKEKDLISEGNRYFIDNISKKNVYKNTIKEIKKFLSSKNVQIRIK